MKPNKKNFKVNIIKRLLVFTLVVFLCIIAYTLSTVFVGMPDKLSQVDEHICNNTPVSKLYWGYIDENGIKQTDCIELNISSDEFRESIYKNIMRKSTYFDPPGVHCVTPDDKYVRMIANRICELTEGYSYERRATVALNFVQTAIQYESDILLYGWDGFISLPIETLYLGKGDCEDTSILLMSIYLVLGYDAVLLDYPEHVAVGVRWEGQNDYMFCETTLKLPSNLRQDIYDCGTYPHIYSIDTIPSLCYYINDSMAGYRYWIERTFGV